jgi:N6-adenosine-specific RNA methylase IME4
MGVKKYNVIYADPPWTYQNKKTGGSMKSGALAKYPTMSIDELKVMDIPAAKDCVLFMWATVPLMPEAIDLVTAWGFKYKTMITWRKIMSLGMGFWFRGQCEHLIVAVKGNVKAFRCQHPNFIQHKALKHSEKPEVFRQLIEQVTPTMTDRLELFARKETEGWDVFGNEVAESIDITIRLAV